jgi:hypothetical protein
MAIKLIVTSPFAAYAKGDEITDTPTVQAVLESENANSVVKVQAPDGAQPAADAVTTK